MLAQCSHTVTTLYWEKISYKGGVRRLIKRSRGSGDLSFQGSAPPVWLNALCLLWVAYWWLVE